MVLFAALFVILLVLVFAVLAHVSWRLACWLVDRSAPKSGEKPPA